MNVKMKQGSRGYIKILMGLILTVCFMRLTGQSVKGSPSPSVLAAAGGFEVRQHITLEWTLGEPFVESVITRANWFTEGFHQPLLSASPLSPSVARGYEIKIYPNPTEELLNILIKTPEEEKLKLTLVDVTGKIIYNQQVPLGTPELQLNLKNIPEGMYLLSLISPKGYRINSFKVIKL